RLRLWQMHLLLLALLALLVPVSAGATLIQLSEMSSDETSASDLSALVDIAVSGTELTIVLENQSQYAITDFYFNASGSVSVLSLSSIEIASIDQTAAWSAEVNLTATGFGADGFGAYDVHVFNTDNLSATTQIEIAQTGTFKFTVNSGLDMLDFVELSTIPPGEFQKLFSAKFQAGPGDDSAFGGSASVVPEPTAPLLFGVGCLVVGAALRRRAVPAH
ncbi:MAG: PEP-CTERM sorting domain-containing protein, partial [Myxococcota bacterium]